RDQAEQAPNGADGGMPSVEPVDGPTASDLLGQAEDRERDRIEREDGRDGDRRPPPGSVLLLDRAIEEVPKLAAYVSEQCEDDGRQGGELDSRSSARRMPARLEEVTRGSLEPDRVSQRRQDVRQRGDLETALVRPTCDDGHHRSRRRPGEHEPSAAERLRASDERNRQRRGPQKGGE